MFKSNTVFIVGAGASVELGLPVGDSLKDLISHKINIKYRQAGINLDSGDPQLANLAQVHCHSKKINYNTYLHEAWKMASALPLAISIDNLLDAHNGNEAVEFWGKLAISQIILEQERGSKLFFDRQNSGKFNGSLDVWHRSFIKLLTENVKRDEVGNLFKNVKFISFNYDRCIENYIREAVKSYYGFSDKEIAEHINDLKIYYPYGRVGWLPSNRGDNLETTTFGDKSADLLKIYTGIRTFSESVEEGDEISEIRASIEMADTLVFLGFAYHQQNMRLLSPSPSISPKNRRIFGTAYGFSSYDVGDIEKSILNSIPTNLVSSGVQIRNDLTCLSLFKEYSRLIASDI